MIRVMIVEDEPPIAQSVKILAEEFHPSVQVVHIAINGQRALEYLETNHVDLLFSDIKMPVMDGLELARILHERYPEILMIIISGFQEFEFAQKAIRYGVRSYLLKPVSAAHVAEVLAPAMETILERRERRTRAMLENAIYNEHRENGLGKDEYCGVILMYGGAYPLIPDEGILGMQELWNVLAIEELLQQLSGGEAALCVRGRSQLELAVVFPCADAARIRTLAEELFQRLSRNGEMAITMAVWEEAVLLHQVGDVFAHLRKRIYKQIRLFHSQLVTSAASAQESFWMTDAQQTNLLLALKTKQLGEISRSIEELIDSAIFQSARQRDLELCLEKILLQYFDGILPMSRISEMKFEVQSALSTSLHPSELVEELSRVFASWANDEPLPSQDDNQQLCEEIAGYLRQHYRESIRGADLARHFGYSSTQLAKKFKDYHGVTVSEFVNNFRIELARTILENNRSVMVKEVALDVGYNDPYYFSKLFKKITGIWPTEYQRQLESHV